MSLRYCESCKTEKPESDFATLTCGKRFNRCIRCQTARRVRLANQALESHLKRTATVVKHRAKKQGIEWNLSSEVLFEMWKEQDGKCAISGAPLTHHVRNNADSDVRTLLSSPTNVSVDRINPTGPYTRENTMLVCSVVNLMRRTMPMDEFIMWTRLIADNFRSGWADD